MKLHWQVLIAMVLGALAGVGMQKGLDGPASTAVSWAERDGALELVSFDAGGPGKLSDLAVGDRIAAVVLDRGDRGQRRVELDGLAALGSVVDESTPGEMLWLERADGGLVSLKLELDPDSPRARILAPLNFIADIFLRLLKMLIVPLVMASIIAGVAGVGSMGDLRRMGVKTFAYYISTSILAILLGQLLVTLVRPGDGAKLGLAAAEPGTTTTSFIDILIRMIPENVPSALTSNGAMLQVIFFAILFGIFATKAGEPHFSRMRELFDSFFAVMLRMAEGVLTLLPYGVFALIARVVASTGFEVFRPLLLYMAVVAGALIIHAAVTLPVLLRVVGGISPLAWFRAMSPALMTAFSTSSSSMTLPVTLETIEKKGKVSNKVTSFTVPLGATINMDGTALYECIGVIFLAQYYASAGTFDLTLQAQGLVVVMALFASVGAAGIPSAGLVMMLTILSALDLPLEGAALLLAVDRPLDMLRTVVNVWSDSCGAAIIARSEGETGPAELGRAGAG